MIRILLFALSTLTVFSTSLLAQEESVVPPSEESLAREKQMLRVQHNPSPSGSESDLTDRMLSASLIAPTSLYNTQTPEDTCYSISPFLGEEKDKSTDGGEDSLTDHNDLRRLVNSPTSFSSDPPAITSKELEQYLRGVTLKTHKKGTFKKCTLL